MFAHLSLRLRVFLFFAFLAIAGAALAGGALLFGWSRAEEALPTAPFITALILFAFLNTGLVLGIWLLFDENVAKPIGRLSANLRLGAHSGVQSEWEAQDARYLGDLAPAAQALTQTASASVTDMASQIARETERLKLEAERLTAVLTEAPVATILLNASMEIVLYDAQAADVISTIAQPRLRAPISEYFDEKEIAQALVQLGGATTEATLTLRDTAGTQSFEARLKTLNSDGYMIFIEPQAARPERLTARPLVFDFGLMNAAEAKDIMDTPLSELCFVAFDTETTGLSVDKDEIVQMGAVRVLNGRIVDGETFDIYVDPGRPIPPASTRVHRVTNEHVVGAPNPAQACERFHQFARDAVLVAHNAPFDIGLLKKSSPHLNWSHPVLDTVLLSAVVFGTTEDHSLDALCEKLNVTLPPNLRHTALGDARATAEALVVLLPLLKGKDIHKFGALIEQTQKHGRLLQDLNA